MSRIGRMMLIGAVAAGMVGGVAVAWTTPQGPTTLEEPPAMPELRRVAVVRASAEPTRDEPAVRLTWTAPAESRVNRADPYTLTVTNTGTQAVQKVVVQVRVPNGVAVGDSEPAASVTGSVLLWELGTMQPRDEKQLRMKLSSPVRGEVAPRAWVTFTGSSTVSVAVKEPKLTLTLDAPESVAVGEEFQVKYRVTNEGDCTAERVLLTVDSAKVCCVKSDEGTDVLADLAPGKYHDGAATRRASATGVLLYTVTTSCADGQKATATARVRVTAPKLEVKVEGPSEIGLTRQAKYVATVTNTGDVTAENVAVRYEPGAGITPPTASPATLYTATPTDPLAASVGSLKPGESKSFAFEGTAAKPGESVAKFTATEKRGAAADAECRTVVKGVPGIRMELVDSVDPVKKGEETVYEIRISNTGTDTDRNLRLQCELPAGMALLSASGPVGYVEKAGVEYMGVGRPVNAGTVTFSTVRELGPKSEVIFKVKVRSGSIGNARFKAALTSDHLTTPVTKEESTTVYGE